MFTVKAIVEAVFDTGSGRNSMDEDYLRIFFPNPSTCFCVVEFVDIELLDCASMIQNRSFTINQMASIKVKFVEAAGFRFA